MPSLEALLASDHEVVAVLTRPDARSGRGRRISRSPVAERADAAGIPVLRPRSPREPEFLARLAELEAAEWAGIGEYLPVPEPIVKVSPH